MANFGSNANVAICWPNLQLMQVVPSCGQIYNLCKWHHLVVKLVTNVSGVILLPNLVQFTESISGSVVPLAMFLKDLGMRTSKTIVPGDMQMQKYKYTNTASIKVSHRPHICYIFGKPLEQGPSVRPGRHLNHVSTSACDTRLNCIVWCDIIPPG